MHIYFIILKTYDQQFTLTTKKSLHIIFKAVHNLIIKLATLPMRYPKHEHLHHSTGNVASSAPHNSILHSIHHVFEVSEVKHLYGTAVTQI